MPEASHTCSMKKILVPTDFSPSATNAAKYAMKLAQMMNASVLLCNAVTVPSATTPASMQSVWPAEDYTAVIKNTNAGLETLANQLKANSHLNDTVGRQAYHPAVAYTSEAGAVTDVIRKLVANQNMPLVVMGMSGAGSLSRFFLGSNSRDLVEKAIAPILLVPADTPYNGILKIAFATDLREQDLDVIQSLAAFARLFNAEILLAHIADQQERNETVMRSRAALLNDITTKAQYAKIQYRLIENPDIGHGLDWLTAYENIDILVMVHRQHHVLYNVFEKSRTQRQARHTKVPLLVFPENHRSLVL